MLLSISMLFILKEVRFCAFVRMILMFQLTSAFALANQNIHVDPWFDGLINKYLFTFDARSRADRNRPRKTGTGKNRSQRIEIKKNARTRSQDTWPSRRVVRAERGRFISPNLIASLERRLRSRSLINSLADKVTQILLHYTDRSREKVHRTLNTNLSRLHLL